MDALGWSTDEMAYDDSLSVAIKELAQNVDYRYLVDPYAEETAQVISDPAAGEAPPDMGGAPSDMGSAPPSGEITNAEDEFGTDTGPMPDLGEGGDNN
jgi:hypothetical protein